MKIAKTEALQKLEETGQLFINLFTRGTLKVEVYRPGKVDLQKPHEQDEVYIVISGSGDFIAGDQRYTFEPNDFLFAPAGMIHRFENFTEDFVTWVLFYGKDGGEEVLELENLATESEIGEIALQETLVTGVDPGNN